MSYKSLVHSGRMSENERSDNAVLFVGGNARPCLIDLSIWGLEAEEVANFFRGHLVGVARKRKRCVFTESIKSKITIRI